MEDEDEDDAKVEVDPVVVTESSCSTWPPLSHEPADQSIANSYFFGGGSGYEFGWNLPPPPPLALKHAEDQSGSYGYGDPFDQIKDSDMAGGTTTSPSGMERQPMVSSSSSDRDRAEKATASGGSTSRAPSADTTSNVKKKGEKRIRQPRYAFMTKSEVDHLEDGYRWRKYGQKAVKNSPYPRSYYRCTNTKCTVKKRVERCCEDPTIVITTYEGQHCHHTVGFPSALIHSNSQFPTQLFPSSSSTNYPPINFRLQQPASGTHFTPEYPTADARESLRTNPLQPERYVQGSNTDQGLLEDIVPHGMRNT